MDAITLIHDGIDALEDALCLDEYHDHVAKTWDEVEGFFVVASLQLAIDVELPPQS